MLGAGRALLLPRVAAQVVQATDVFLSEASCPLFGVRLTRLTDDSLFREL